MNDTSRRAPRASFPPEAIPQLRPCLELTVEVGQAQELGIFQGGRRRVIPILGGTLRSAELQGEVLPGGADWQTLQPDGTTYLVARYTIRLQDGSTVGIVNRGIRRADPEVTAQLAAGAEVDLRRYYFLTTPRFEVGPGPHQWLAQQLFIGRGVRYPREVVLYVHSVD